MPALLIVCTASQNSRFEQHPRRTRLERRTRRSNLRRHHLTVRPDVVQLVSIGPPPWIDPAFRRNLPLFVAVRRGRAVLRCWTGRRSESPHEYFRPPGLVGDIRNPAAIRRELACTFGK